jgi:hypothetical protein
MRKAPRPDAGDVEPRLEDPRLLERRSSSPSATTKQGRRRWRQHADPASATQRESAVQRALCQHINVRGVAGLVWFAVPNGNKLGGKISAKGIAIQGSINRGFGVKAGVADLIFLHDAKFFTLELKVGNNRPTEPQLEFIARVNAAGGYACWCSGLDAALRILESWQLLRGSSS